MNLTETSNSDFPENRGKFTDAEIDQIRDALDGLHFGALQIIVQDGVIVQIDRTEKRRLQRRSKPATN